jgi:hypothetical protein
MLPSTRVISLILLGWALGFLSAVLNAGQSIRNTSASIEPLHNTSRVHNTSGVLEDPQEIESSLVQVPPIIPGSVTLVGVWFKLEKSKHSHDAYVEWSKNYFALECDMVIW